MGSRIKVGPGGAAKVRPPAGPGQEAPSTWRPNHTPTPHPPEVRPATPEHRAQPPTPPGALRANDKVPAANPAVRSP